MIKPIELVIFDCDGVLVDSEPIAVRIEAEVLAELGWRLTESEIVDRFVGRTTESMRKEIEAHLGRGLPAGWEDEMEARYRAALLAELAPVDGVVAALDALAHLPACIASSGSHDKMRLTLGHTGLFSRFEGRIFSASEVGRGKPAPDLFLHAAERMGVAPDRCVVVEDSQYGVQAARAAGMRAFGYAGGLTPARWLEGPDTIVFDDMLRLPALLAAG
ncbi:haloacid dehalogenase [Streptomyces cinnamoneus]|uniref:Haloacid dehalogenase n=1 Tax=Streptomyces cinnamoneus TaxID=53446 RepID=A0A2G1XJH7_STRCJ|nr:HAD family hydrolase [Streptomyces cinnamoneus]PHQ51385.1 haloacid dehalogenase [Streptomyces cinnamoneus]PPT11725.1 haloacid dehalogenase [Streptomyces cinnamoneus]